MMGGRLWARSLQRSITRSLFIEPDLVVVFMYKRPRHTLVYTLAILCQISWTIVVVGVCLGT